MGTGWVLDSQCIVTAAHVIEGYSVGVVTTQEIEVAFSDGARRVRVTDEDVDWQLDVAVLRLEDCNATLPSALALASLKNMYSKSSLTWASWGFPKKVNPTGFVLSGQVSGLNVDLPSGATVVQLGFDQHQADVMGGASGSPVLVNGRCVAVIIRHPANLPVGTLLATALDDLVRLAPVREALREGESALPEALMELLAHQQRSHTTTRSPTLGSHTASVFVSRTLVTRDGVLVSLNALAQALPIGGVVIEGEAGSGKSRLLSEIMHRCARGDDNLGFSRRPVPLLVHASALLGQADIFELLALRSPLSPVRLRELADSATHQWLFLVDALDEAIAASGSGRRIEESLALLDTLCRRHGHRWIATRRTNSSALWVPDDASILFLKELSLDEGENMTRELTEKCPDEARELFSRLPRSITRNPLLLRAAVELVVYKNGRRPASPAQVLMDFVTEVMAGVQSRHERASRDLSQIFRSTPLIMIASMVAPHDMDQAIEVVEVALEERAGLGRVSARRWCKELLTEVLPATGIVRVDDTDVIWSHALYKSAVVGHQLAENWPLQSPPLEAIRSALASRSATAVSLAAVVQQDRVDVLQVINDLPEEDAPQLLVDFLAFGGRADPEVVNGFIGYLCNAAHAQKHRRKSCAALLSTAFSPFEGLMSLGHIPQARECLEHLSTDLLADDDLRLEIRSRLSIEQKD